MTLHNPAHAEHVLRHLEAVQPRVVEASELPSEAQLEVVQAQLAMLVCRAEPPKMTEEELDYFFSKPEEP